MRLFAVACVVILLIPGVVFAQTSPLETAARSVGVATRDFALGSAACDVVAPGTWSIARANLREALGELWTPSMEQMVEDAVASESSQRSIERMRTSLANGEFEVRDLRAACDERLHQARVTLADAIERYNFLSRTER